MASDMLRALGTAAGHQSHTYAYELAVVSVVVVVVFVALRSESGPAAVRYPLHWCWRPVRIAHCPSRPLMCRPPHHHQPLRQPSPTTVLETKCPGTHNCISPANNSYCLMELFWKTRRPSIFSTLCLRP